MLAAERQCLGQRRPPDVQGLDRNREHQVEIQIVETGPAQKSNDLKTIFRV